MVGEPTRSRAHDPHLLRKAAASRSAGRLVRAGIFVLVVGVAFTYFVGGGLLQLMLVAALGSALIAAGFRGRPR